MTVNYITTNVGMSEAMKEYVEKKLGKQTENTDENITVTLSLAQNGVFKFTITNGKTRVTKKTRDFYEACDIATDVYNKLLRKHRETLKSRKEKEIALAKKREHDAGVKADKLKRKQDLKEKKLREQKAKEEAAQAETAEKENAIKEIKAEAEPAQNEELENTAAVEK